MLFVLDSYYVERQDQYCMKNGNTDSFSELDAAKSSCLTNDNCVGLFGYGGEGNRFTLCNKPLIVQISTTGYIFYQKQSKGKIINYVGDYVLTRKLL